jgi:hypothetical protein
MAAKRPNQEPLLRPGSEAERRILAKRASYVGSKEHKVERWWGGLPARYSGKRKPARHKKQKTTICPLLTEAERDIATGWVQLRSRPAATNSSRVIKTSLNTFGTRLTGKGGSGSALTRLQGSTRVGRWKRMNLVRFLIDWLDDAPNAAAEERATAGDLKIWIGDQNVCLHLDVTESCDHITLPAYSLAHGIAHDWWSIFGGRDREYRLIRHRMGYAIPDIRFRFDGAVFEARAHERRYQNPDVRFWFGVPEVLSRPEAEAALTDLVTKVLDRLDAREVSRTSAKLRWERVMASRNNAEEATFCEAAGALSADPYRVDEHVSTFIEQASRIFFGEPLIEFLAGLGGSAHRERTLEWIDSAESRPRHLSVLPKLAAIANEVARKTPARAGEAGWALGYRRARATRAALRLSTSERIGTVTKLAQKFGSRSFSRAQGVDGLRALVSTDRGDAHVHLRGRSNSQSQLSELFAFGRSVGDAVCFPTTRRAAVNDLHEAVRQAAGRAFAAEFLAPIDEIRSMQADGRDVAAIADELAVDTTVVERQIENADRIVAACGT